MKFQLVTFNSMDNEEHRPGIAKMLYGFDMYDIVFIVDCGTGEIHTDDVKDYSLHSGPLAYIDQSY